MLIRDYQEQDFEQLLALWKDTGIYTVERGDTREIILRCIAQGGKLLVLVDPRCGKIRGSSWMTWDGRRVFLHHFAVGPELQGRGYGRKLAEASLEFARQKGSPIKLEVHRGNTPAVKLYQSLGFEVFNDYDTYMLLDPS
jgi:ribosomal protein S18 acetylase RimI-like enzyme